MYSILLECQVRMQLKSSQECFVNSKTHNIILKHIIYAAIQKLFIFNTVFIYKKLGDFLIEFCQAMLKVRHFQCLKKYTFQNFMSPF